MRSKQSNGYDDVFMASCREELTLTEHDIRTDCCWVAEDKAPCGVVGLSFDQDGSNGVVFSFFVDPNLKRKGIGQRLWQSVVEHARAQGLKSLQLDADPEAVPFYTALGFQITGEVPSGSIEGRMLPHMTIDLE